MILEMLHLYKEILNTIVFNVELLFLCVVYFDQLLGAFVPAQVPTNWLIGDWWYDFIQCTHFYELL